jgi:hypothetical protein
LSAIYRLLQGRLPDLCNPSDRAQIFWTKWEWVTKDELAPSSN